MAKEMFTGAEIFLKSLEAEGVDEIFGYPGGVILNIYEALYNQDKIKHYLVRHEQAAIHAAEGYARVSGRPGVALVTSGPGATNTITGIANAYYDGYPLVVFTGQVSTDQIGNDAFQEADIVGITRSCCKHNYLVKDVKDLARVIKEAFYIATTGKPGPVVIDMPKDILTAKTTFDYPKEVKLVSYNPTYKGHPLQISKALKLNQIDFMFGNTQFTANMEISSQASPFALLYYDRLMLLAKAKDGATSMEAYKGSTVCTVSNSEDYQHILDFSNRYKLNFKYLKFDTNERAKTAFLLDRCQLLPGNEVYLKGIIKNNYAKETLQRYTGWLSGLPAQRLPARREVPAPTSLPALAGAKPYPAIAQSQEVHKRRELS